jgi:hypothetical protein
MGVVSAYGCYVAMNGIKERREMAREKIWTRIHLTPMLQAEADRDDVRRYWAAEKREKELMKGVKGWEVGGVYNSDRYCLFPGAAVVGWGLTALCVYRFVRPTYTVSPPAESVISEKDYLKIVGKEEK